MRVLSKLWPGFRRDLINSIVCSFWFPRPLRWRTLRLLGMRIESARISPTVWFGSFERVTIGSGTFVNYGCMFNSSAHITIGRNCDVGMRVSFVTSSHEIGAASRRAGAAKAAPIHIGDGVWIGAGAVILPGVNVGDGSIIAAGAVVNKDCASNSVYGGIPAKLMRVLQ